MFILINQSIILIAVLIIFLDEPSSFLVYNINIFVKFKYIDKMDRNRGRVTNSIIAIPV